MSKVKIRYGSEGFEKYKWYVMPVHGEDFNKKNIPTEWSVQMLDTAIDALEGDLMLVIAGFTYHVAKEICDRHNEIIDMVIK